MQSKTKKKTSAAYKPVKIKSIKIVEEKFDLKQLDFKLSSAEEKELYKLLPKPKKSITFEIDKTTSALANALRRTIEDELPLYSLHCKINSFISDDKRIMTTSDCIVRRINLIPLQQELAKLALDSKFKMSIDIHNNTHDSILITSKNITITSAINTKGEYKKDQAKNISNDLYFPGSISICELERGKRLVISDINITQHKNYELSVGSLSYQSTYLPLDYEYELRNNKPLPNCLVTNPDRYLLGYNMNGETPPRYVIQLACTVLTNRLKNIKKAIETSDNEIPYNSDLLRIYKSIKKTIVYYITGESWTIGYLIRRYAYDIDPTIPKIITKNKHMLTDSIQINIKHAQPQKLLLAAIDNILIDLSIISQAFS